MKLYIVLDGAAEDWGHGKTSMQIANLPTLDKLASGSRCGFFDPRDPETGLINTDIIVATLLGIKPEVWPGRAYYEKSHFPGLEQVSFSFILRYHDLDTKRDVGRTREMKILASREISQILESKGLRRRPRKFSRLGLSDLVTGESSELNELNGELARCAAGYSLGVRFQDMSAGLNGEHPQFAELPALFGFSKGSLPAIIKKAGITDITPEGSMEFKPEVQMNAMDCYISELNNNQYRAAVIYYKDPDWAAHKGDAKLKIKSLECFDLRLSNLFAKTMRFEQVAIISDHITNIGSGKPAPNPSPFWIWRKGERVKHEGVFSEVSARRFSDYSSVISMHELNEEFFKGH